MKLKLITVLIAFAMLMITPVSADRLLEIDNVSVLFGSIFAGPVTNVYDNDIGTWLSLDAVAGEIGVNYGAGTVINSCNLYSRDSITRTFNLNPVGGTGNSSWYLSVPKDTWQTKTFPNSLYNSVRVGVDDGNWFQLAEIDCYGYNTTDTLTPPIADYSCNFDYPYGSSPFNLVCVDNSTYFGSITQSWTITYPDDSIYNTANASLTRTLTQEGWHGMDYIVCNAYGCGYKNTTQFINLTSGYIPATGIHFWATNYDPLKSAVVKPSDIKLQNLTSGFWRNVSSTGGTIKFNATDTALTELITAGQTVKLCGYAPGYAETCYNVTIPYSGWEYKINLASTSAVPTGTNATLFVNVLDSYTAEGLAGATVTIANASIPYSKSMLSNAGGIASFVNIDPGTYSISATKTGYQSSVTSWTAPSGLVTNAYIGLLPVGMTPVVTGTGGENLYDDNGNPIIGYDLSGNPITAGPTPDTRTDEEKDSEMMDLLRDQGPMLIQFFIVCFVVYMIMGIGKGR